MKPSSECRRLKPGARYGRWTLVGLASPQKGNRYWHAVCDCGTTKVVSQSSLVQGASLSCGCLKSERARARTREKHHLFKGGRRVQPNGYVQLTAVPADWPIEWGYPPMPLYEHSYVMAKHIGRPLIPKVEQVHHLNGDRTDNRIENLELWTRSQPPGQRVVDMVKWAREIIERYGNLV